MDKIKKFEEFINESITPNCRIGGIKEEDIEKYNELEILLKNDGLWDDFVEKTNEGICNTISYYINEYAEENNPDGDYDTTCELMLEEGDFEFVEDITPFTIGDYYFKISATIHINPQGNSRGVENVLCDVGLDIECFDSKTKKEISTFYYSKDADEETNLCVIDDRANELFGL